MKYTQVAANAFQKLQLNAGMLLTDFDPASGAVDRTKIFAATGGGVNFQATPTFIDFGEDIDNVPENTMELKQLDRFDVTLSGTAKTVDTDFAQAVVAAADVSGNKVTPRSVLLAEDFQDIWWVGDYSDVNTGSTAGFMAVRLINALSTGGFQIQSNDKGKGDFAFTFTAHYSMDDIDVVPFEIYIAAGTRASADATLASLTLGSLTLTPTFDSETTEYEATTTNATTTITATPNDEDATATITVNEVQVQSGSSATWSAGENTVRVVVVNGTASMAYTVTVTKN